MNASTMATTPPAADFASSKDFTCTLCSVVFSRQDHLERHRKTAHSVRNSADLPCCPECNSRFSRRDVLLRHCRLVHGISCEPRRKGRPKVNRNVSQARRKSDTQKQSSKAIMIPSPFGGSLDGSHDPPTEQNKNMQDLPSIAHGGGQSLQSPGGFQPRYTLPDYQFEQDLSLFDWMNGEGSLTLLDDANDLFFPALSDSVPNAVPIDSAMLTSQDHDIAERATAMPVGDEVVGEPVMGSPEESDAAICSPGYSLRGSKSSRTAHLQPVPIDRCSSSDPWPLEWHASREEQHIIVPLLSPVSQGEDGNTRDVWKLPNLASTSPVKDGNTNELDEISRKNILDLLSLPFDHHPWQENVKIFASFPRREILDHFVNLYFLRFHEFWPIIHRPTFQINVTPMIVVLSMACIGACYSDLENSGEFANTLAELCRRSSGWMAEYDSRFLRSPYYGIALLLQYIHAIGSGSRRLFEMADCLRSRLVSTGRYMNLFGGKPQSSPPLSADNIQQRWLEWISREQVKRFAWFLFEFDCLYVAFSKQPPCVKLEDCPPELPCEQMYWEAPTAFAWAESLPWSQSVPCGLHISSLHSLLTEPGRASFSFQRTDSFGKRLLVRCIGHLLEIHQDLAESRYSTLLWGEAGQNAVRAARCNLSVTTMSIYESIRSDISHTIDLRQTLRVAVAVHYSHIFAAGRAVDLVTRAARKWAAGYQPPSVHAGSATDRTMDDALNSITLHFKQDPIASRELAWHASQVLYIQRHYPLNSPHEPLSVFLAGTFLWAFAKCYIMTPEERQLPPIRLDTPLFSSNEQTIVAENAWIQNGGQANLEPVGNIFHSEAPRLVLSVFAEMTQRLRVWGMAAKISGVFGRMLQREEEAIRDKCAAVNK